MDHNISKNFVINSLVEGDCTNSFRRSYATGICYSDFLIPLTNAFNEAFFILFVYYKDYIDNGVVKVSIVHQDVWYTQEMFYDLLEKENKDNNIFINGKIVIGFNERNAVYRLLTPGVEILDHDNSNRLCYIVITMLDFCRYNGYFLGFLEENLREADRMFNEQQNQLSMIESEIKEINDLKDEIKDNCKCSGIHISLTFIRHGFSCANYKKHFETFGRITKTVKTDPPLTNYSKKRIVDSFPLECPDILLSSTLLRAIESSYYSCPEKQVIVAPFIKEIGFGLDNKSRFFPYQWREFEKQKDKFENWLESNHPNTFCRWSEEKKRKDPVNYYFVSAYKESDENYDKGRVTWDLAQNSSLKLFLFWLVAALPTLIEMNGIENKSDISIHAFCHSNFMKKFLGVGKQKNLGSVTLNYCYNISEETLYRIDQEECGCDLLSKQDSNSKYCDSIPFSGFNVPNKKNFRLLSGNYNC